jgi:hypothetical protein
MTDNAAPPMRHYLPTLPCDLRDYAWIHTGPSSWSAQSDDLREVLSEPETMCSLLEDEPLSSVVDGPLMEVRRSDIPRATSAAAYVAPVLDERERRVLALLDGETTIGALLASAGQGEAEVLDTLSDLCQRGVVVFTARDGTVRDLDAE